MNKRSIINNILIILFWIGIWAVAASYFSKPLLLPSPISVFIRIFSLLTISEFWKILIFSLLRIMLGILSGVMIGIVLATITTYSRFFYELFSPILTVIKVTPVASFIILVLIWIGRDIVPAVIAALMVLPVVWTNISTGLKNIDRDILEMAKMYQLSKLTQCRRILIPSVMPYFSSAIQTSIGIGWKAGIAAEVLTVPVYSIGKMIYDSKMYLETVDLFAWTTIVIVISLVIEKFMIVSLKKLVRK